jgi:DNA-binding PadR family transcriptional regulator
MPKRSTVPRAAEKAPAARNRVKASLELALLGLIAETSAVSGYDLLKTFNYSMAHYWHARHGQIYSTLESLERRKLIQSREVIQRGRPNKRLYTITAAGRAALREWLESPYEGLRFKHAPLLRCRFLAYLGADQAKATLKEERDACAVYLDKYRAIESEAFRSRRSYRSPNEMFAYFTLKRGIMFFEETMRWCQWSIAEIENNRGLFNGAVKPVAEPGSVRTRRAAVR